MLSDNAKKGKFFDFSDSDLWREIPHRALEDLRLYPENQMLEELIDKIVATQELRHFYGELDLEFNFGTDRAREFWRNEKDALRENVSSEYEDLKEKISKGVFKVKPIASKSNKIRAFFENILSSGKPQRGKAASIVPVSIDILKDRETDTTAAVTSSSYTPPERQKKPSIHSRI
jgi:hypothetical protein